MDSQNFAVTTLLLKWDINTTGLLYCLGIDATLDTIFSNFIVWTSHDFAIYIEYGSHSW